jgi:ABC-type antimicrobial peptide transport system permease subunit
VTGVRTLDAVLRENVAPQRFNAVLLGSFAVFALLLAAVGVYGAMSYAVSLRAQEIGVRMAMGARGSEVFRMILRRGMALAGTGAGVGLLGALGLSHVLSSLLHDVSPQDPLTFAAMALLLLSTSALACAVPAWRATRVDPLTTLRQG